MSATIRTIETQGSVGLLSETFVPPRFIDAVAGHVALNALFPYLAPLILAIIGPTGTGKSYQLRKIAERLGWKIVEIPASALAGEREGAVVRVLHDGYRQAAEGLVDHPQAFLAIDDFDLSLASIREHVETSQHTQLLRSAFMELCDRPAGIASQFPLRVPIIITTNSLDAVYAPLIRYGRMHVLHWEPTADELKAIVARILIGLPEATVTAITARYAGEGLAFFRELKSETLKDLVVARIRRDGAAIADIQPAAIESEYRTLPIEQFDVIATRIRSGRDRLNYLRS